MARPSLLIIDDDDDLRELLAEVLDGEGYRVRSAPSGAEGLRMLDGVDLVLLDLHMRGMNGAATARAIRATAPIVLVSAHADLAEVASEIGSPYFVGKPFQLDDLLATIEAALASSR